MKFRSICALLTGIIGLTISSVSAIDMAAGVKGGLNLSKGYGDDVEGTEMKMLPGFVVGGAFQLRFSDYFAIQPEILFSSKGSKMVMSYEGTDPDGEVDGTTYDVTTSLHLRYLEIPILVQLLIPAGDAVTPMIYAGPAIAFKMGIAGKYDSNGEEEDFDDDDIDLFDEMTKSVDFGIAMGAGLGIKAGPGKVILDARFTLGLLNIRETSDDEKEFLESVGESEPVNKNMAVSIMCGYMFDF